MHRKSDFRIYIANNITFLVFTQFVNYDIITDEIGLHQVFFYKKIHYGSVIKC